MAAKFDKADPSELTERQRLFALRVLTGDSKTLSDAYRYVYDCKGESKKQKKSQSNEASRLWSHPGIKKFSDEFRQNAENNRTRRAVGERESIRKRLWSEADQADKSSDRLTALKMLGQEAGMFTDKVEVIESSDVMSDAEVIAEIELVLREALESGQPVSSDEPVLVEDVRS